MNHNERLIGTSRQQTALNWRRTAMLGTTILLLQPLAAMSQEWAEVYEAMQAEQARQLEPIDLYVKQVTRSGLPGMDSLLEASGGGACASMTNCDVVKVETVTSSTGSPGRHKRTLSPTEVMIIADLATSPEVLGGMGMGLLVAQNELNRALPGLQGLGMLGVPAWINPGEMLGVAGLMFMGASIAVAEAQNSLATSAQQAQADTVQIEAAFVPLENSGTDSVNGIAARKYETPSGTELAKQSLDNGGDATITGAVIWIDPARMHELKFRFEGTMEAEGQTRDFFIEVENDDFRNPPGCGDMYVPYRKIMRMGGMLDDSQMAEMEEARAQLAEFEQQMASMPAQQRQMVERMMGSQMDMLRGMTSSGAMELVEQTEQIICNPPDLASLFGMGGAATGGANTLLSADALLTQIQRYLVELGYMPGNTNGVLDVLTQVAISQFQAEHGLAVTGEPSSELAEFMAGLVAE